MTKNGSVKMNRFQTLLCAAALLAASEPFQARAGALSAPRSTISTVQALPRLELSVGFRKFSDSFASYQFPDPDTGTNPLSRLEFPIDTWFVGLRVTRPYRRCSLNVEYWTHLNGKTFGAMRDSDWEDPGNPSLRTTYSESMNRVVDGQMADASLDWNVARIGRWTLGPRAGYRWQTIRFIAGNGYQMSNSSGSVRLDGDTFDVRYSFDHAYLGGFARAVLGRSTLHLGCDGGWGRVKETDRHLLRGARLTSDEGRSTVYHVTAGVSRSLTRRVDLKLDWDFQRIVADNVLHFWNEADGVTSPQSWSGARVWSDQNSITASTIVRF